MRLLPYVASQVGVDTNRENKGPLGKTKVQAQLDKLVPIVVECLELAIFVHHPEGLLHSEVLGQGSVLWFGTEQVIPDYLFPVTLPEPAHREHFVGNLHLFHGQDKGRLHLITPLVHQTLRGPRDGGSAREATMHSKRPGHVSTYQTRTAAAGIAGVRYQVVFVHRAQQHPSTSRVTRLRRIRLGLDTRLGLRASWQGSWFFRLLS